MTKPRTVIAELKFKLLLMRAKDLRHFPLNFERLDSEPPIKRKSH